MTLEQKDKKLTAQYAVTYAVYYAAYACIRALISVFLLERGFTYTQVGLITAFHMAASALIQPQYAGILSHFPHLSLRHFTVICCVLSVLESLLLLICTPSMPLYILTYILIGCTEVGLESMMMSIGLSYNNAGSHFNAGLGRGFGSLGYAVASALLGMLIARFGSMITMPINIGLLLLTILLLWMLPSEESFREYAKEGQAISTENETPDSLLVFVKKEKAFALFMFSEIFIFFGHCIVNTYLPDVAAQFGLGADFTGILVAIAAMTELIPMALYTRISRKCSPLTLLSIAAVSFFVKILVMTLAFNSACLVISQLMQISAFAIYSITSVYLTNQMLEPKNRVMAQGLLCCMLQIGFMIGSFTGGIILDHSSIRVLLWLAVAITAIGSTLMLLSVRMFKEKKLQS